MNSNDPISAFIEKGIEEGHFPGAVLWVQRGRKVLYKNAWGYSALIPNKRKMTLDTLFDIASITKVMATGTAMLLLLQNSSPVGTLVNILQKQDSPLGIHFKGGSDTCAHHT